MKAQAAQESSFDRKRHMIGAVFGPICALLVYFLPIAGLADNPEAHKLLAIVTFVAFWWILRTGSHSRHVPDCPRALRSYGSSLRDRCHHLLFGLYPHYQDDQGRRAAGYHRCVHHHRTFGILLSEGYHGSIKSTL